MHDFEVMCALIVHNFSLKKIILRNYYINNYNILIIIKFIIINNYIIKFLVESHMDLLGGRGDMWRNFK